jgi:peptide subunit release factor 1 (eRF1)
MLRLLDMIETGIGPAASIYVPRGLSVSEVVKTLAVVPDAGQVSPDIAAEAVKSTTGTVLFWGEQQKYMIVPPFPVVEKMVSPGYDVEGLRHMLQQDRTIALVLVRLGSYAVGVFQNSTLLSSKVGTGLIHSRHKKGGSSQRRFERRRETQMHEFFKRVCQRAQEKIEPYIQQIDFVRYGGEHGTVRSFRQQCRFLDALQDRTLEVLLNVREPRQATLEKAIDDAWSSRVVQWKEGR